MASTLPTADFSHLPDPNLTHALVAPVGKVADKPLSASTKTSGSATLTSNLIAFLTGVHGRDKFYRLCQFACKFVALLLRNRPGAGTAAGVFDSLASGIVAGRRFLRIGSIAGHVQGIEQALEERDSNIRTLLTSSRVASLGFLLLDNFSWSSRQGLFRMDYEYWTFFESCAWLLSIVFSMASSFLMLQKIAQRTERLRSEIAQTPSPSAANQDEMRSLHQRRRYLRADILRNLLDLPLAASGLSKSPSLSPLLLTTAGLVSSWIGCKQTWPAGTGK
jgi:hypothetical protein